MVDATRGIGTRLNDLGDRIEQENDPERRYVFLLFQDLTSILYDIHKSVKDTNHDHYTKIDIVEKKIRDFDEKMKAHEKLVVQGKVAWRIVTLIFASVSLLLSGAVSYGGSLIYGMNKTIIEQAVVLPRLESLINEVSLQRQVLVEAHEAIQQQCDAINQRDEKLKGLDTYLDNIKSKKVIRE